MPDIALKVAAAPVRRPKGAQPCGEDRRKETHTDASDIALKVAAAPAQAKIATDTLAFFCFNINVVFRFS